MNYKETLWRVLSDISSVTCFLLHSINNSAEVLQTTEQIKYMKLRHNFNSRQN